MTDIDPKDLPALPSGVYQHYKGEKYLVLGYAHDANGDWLYRGSVSEGSGEIEHEWLGPNRYLVLYVPLYYAKGPRFAVRDVDDFFAPVKTDLGEVPRFRYIGPG